MAYTKKDEFTAQDIRLAEIGKVFSHPARVAIMKLLDKQQACICGDIEAIPIESNTADVIASNCVLNLVPDKQKAFACRFRVLKPGGHFTVSDIVLQGNLPEALQQEIVMNVGCVAGGA